MYQDSDPPYNLCVKSGSLPNAVTLVTIRSPTCDPPTFPLPFTTGSITLYLTITWEYPIDLSKGTTISQYRRPQKINPYQSPTQPWYLKMRIPYRIVHNLATWTTTPHHQLISRNHTPGTGKVKSSHQEYPTQVNPPRLEQLPIHLPRIYPLCNTVQGWQKVHLRGTSQALYL